MIMKRYFLYRLFLCLCFVAGVVAENKIMPFNKAEIIGINDPPLPPRVCAKAKCAEKVPAHLDYWYRGYCKDKFPDFAALAVFESQTCPPIQRNDEDSLCVSRYRIIRVLDSVSDTLKKEYIEVKEYPLLPCFRYRPILIFGEYNNGTIQVKWYEDVREYFFPLIQQDILFGSHRFFTRAHIIIAGIIDIWYGDHSMLYNLYSLHSMGTPYYNADTTDDIEKRYCNEYLIPEAKFIMGNRGKDFNKLRLRLTQNRTKIKTTPIKNDFVALGMIKNMRTVKDSKQKKMCVLDIMPETIIKNRTDIDSSITVCKYGDCPSLTSMLTPKYFLGDVKTDGIVIEKMVSALDAFVFCDTIYDISMGLPFDEFIRYFLPSTLSLDDYILAFYFDSRWIDDDVGEEIISIVKSEPKQKRRIEAAIIKYGLVHSDFLRKQPEQEKEIEIRRRVFREQFGSEAVTRSFNRYRCRK
jgi:hypothetical protein